MVRNRTVYCKVCGKELAWWDMFTNIQYEDEWECLGEFRKKLTNTWVYKEKDGNKITAHGHKTSPHPGAKPLKSEMSPCSLHYHTKYCTSCVRKIGFKCVRPRCKGKIRLVRRKDGSSTKYAHGGW